MGGSEQQVVKLFDEVRMMHELRSDTLSLIHSTTSIKPIKKLVEVHDILDITLMIEAHFSDYRDNPPWDVSLLRDMNSIRAELIVFHRPEFNPVSRLDTFSAKMLSLFHVIKANNAKAG